MITKEQMETLIKLTWKMSAEGFNYEYGGHKQASIDYVIEKVIERYDNAVDPDAPDEDGYAAWS